VQDIARAGRPAAAVKRFGQEMAHHVVVQDLESAGSAAAAQSVGGEVLGDWEL
jgi:hypothetical protein